MHLLSIIIISPIYGLFLTTATKYSRENYNLLYQNAFQDVNQWPSQIWVAGTLAVLYCMIISQYTNNSAI